MMIYNDILYRKVPFLVSKITPIPHHLRLNISLAAVIGAALPVAIWAKSRKSHLLSGAPLAGLLPVVM